MGTRQIRRSFLDENIRPRPELELLCSQKTLHIRTECSARRLMSFKGNPRILHPKNINSMSYFLANLPFQKIRITNWKKQKQQLQTKTRTSCRRNIVFVSGFLNKKHLPAILEKIFATGRPSSNHKVGHLLGHQVDHQVVDIMELHHLMEDWGWVIFLYFGGKKNSWGTT